MNTDGFTSVSSQMSPRCVNRHATGIDRRQDMREVDRINQPGPALEGIGRLQPTHPDLIRAYDLSAGARR